MISKIAMIFRFFQDIGGGLTRISYRGGGFERHSPGAEMKCYTRKNFEINLNF